jgi:membrane-bound lytic murein transglycosylase D
LILPAGKRTRNKEPKVPALPSFKSAAIALSLLAVGACSHTPVYEVDPPATRAAETSPTKPALKVAPRVSLPPSSVVAAEPLICTPDTQIAWVDAGHDDIWARVRAGFALDLDTENPRVKAELNWFGQHQDYIDRVVNRASLYLYYVVEEIDRHNVPMELALLPIVESAYDPFAYSHGRASGMWQFIPNTGKHYGLKQNWWYDGRRDVRASTSAAIKYLTELNKRYKGDWALALAAYNVGQGNVDRAIRRNKKQGKPTDFWSLQLPRETRMYVPRLLAVAKIVENPAAFNVSLRPVPNEPYFHPVDIGGQIDLAEAARLADVSVEDLYRLNPGFNRWATDPKGPFELLLPVERADSFADSLSERSATVGTKGGVEWEQYKVVSGDNLGLIAMRHKTSVSAIKLANELSSNTIRPGQQLMIPLSASAVASGSKGATQAFASNKAVATDGNKINYKVRSGDSMWKIARKYNVSIKNLASWNGLSPKKPIKPGMNLAVWTKGGPVTSAKRSSSNPLPASEHVRKVGYTVRNGDSLARIASRFNVKLQDILKWNPLDRPEYLRPGQSLTLYVDVTNVN